MWQDWDGTAEVSEMGEKLVAVNGIFTDPLHGSLLCLL